MTKITKTQMEGEDSEHAYVTHKEVRAINKFHGQTVLAIRAPAGTTLEVPDPDEGLHGTGKRRFQIFLRSQDGAVTTFLVSSARDDSQTMPSKPSAPTPNACPASASASADPAATTEMIK